MKVTPHLILALILLSICANSILLCSAAAPKPVLDVARNKVRTGETYYILPVVRGRGGGLTLSFRINSNTSCPLVVVQEQQEVQKGFPVRFFPVNPKEGVIRESTDMNIISAAPSGCRQSTTWKLDSYDELTKQNLITTNGVQGNPGRETVDNWFKIEAYENDYKLVFCPSVCNVCKVRCGDLGIFLQDGMRYLALSDVPFRVMFKKA